MHGLNRQFHVVNDTMFFRETSLDAHFAIGERNIAPLPLAIRMQRRGKRIHLLAQQRFIQPAARDDDTGDHQHADTRQPEIEIMAFR